MEDTHKPDQGEEAPTAQAEAVSSTPQPEQSPQVASTPAAQPTPAVVPASQPAASPCCSLTRLVVVSLLVSALSSMGSLYWYHNKIATQVVSADLAGYMLALQEQVVAGKLKKEEALLLLKAYKEKLGALPGNYKVISSEIAFSNITDIKP